MYREDYMLVVLASTCTALCSAVQCGSGKVCPGSCCGRGLDEYCCQETAESESNSDVPTVVIIAVSSVFVVLLVAIIARCACVQARKRKKFREQEREIFGSIQGNQQLNTICPAASARQPRMETSFTGTLCHPVQPPAYLDLPPPYQETNAIS